MLMGRGVGSIDNVKNTIIVSTSPQPIMASQLILLRNSLSLLGEVDYQVAMLDKKVK